MLASAAVSSVRRTRYKIRITEQKYNLPLPSKYLYKYSVNCTEYGVLVSSIGSLSGTKSIPYCIDHTTNYHVIYKYVVL
jgi:hypothetical protein